MPIELDRVSPTRRPAAAVVGHQRWDSLLFLHWSVPMQVLRPLIPEPLSIDTFEGRAWISIIPFTLMNARVLGMPIPGAVTFHELNVRTYVHFEGQDPGVWFFSLDAASPLACALARVSVRLPYFFAKIRREETLHQRHYVCDRRAPSRPAHFEASWDVSAEARTASPGSLEFFLTERHLLYSRALGDTLRMGRVHHPPWQLQQVPRIEVVQDLDRADGLPALGAPELAHFSSGVEVDFFSFLLKRPTRAAAPRS